MLEMFTLGMFRLIFQADASVHEDDYIFLASEIQGFIRY